MRMLLLTFVVAIMMPGFSAVSGQPSGGLEFGREPGVKADGSKKQETRYRGRSDSIVETPSATAYRGNVVVRFPDAHMVLRADEMMSTAGSSEITLTGSVRVMLDSD